ncbi:hypothetical protein EVAR_12986_1 [Eumeta japonica]|uniref:Uncharacterized protein n=1 Tax=Eumeta variegata TaxID=151549 RepID=A0A4C1TWU5_EUMVA|nr:hypothetical protein EVAR_12986_1 [Eumeta japonica]
MSRIEHFKRMKMFVKLGCRVSPESESEERSLNWVQGSMRNRIATEPQRRRLGYSMKMSRIDRVFGDEYTFLWDDFIGMGIMTDRVIERHQRRRKPFFYLQAGEVADES